MEDYPPPLGTIPELVSTSPYFDFAELVIIPVWRQSDRAHFIRTMSTNTINKHAAQLIKSHPPTRSESELSGAPHINKGIVPKVHEIRLRFNTSVRLILQWRGFTQTITLPHFITCKQLWIWLSYFIISKITHLNLPEQAQL